MFFKSRVGYAFTVMICREKDLSCIFFAQFLLYYMITTHNMQPCLFESGLRKIVFDPVIIFFKI